MVAALEGKEHSGVDTPFGGHGVIVRRVTARPPAAVLSCASLDGKAGIMRRISSARHRLLHRGALLGVISVAMVALVAGCSSASTSTAPASTSPASPGAVTTAPSAGASTATTAAPTGGGSGSFCDDAKKLADLNAQAAKDISGTVNVIAPDYVAKSMSDSVTQLNAMASDAPAAVAAVAKEYFTAYVDYAHEVASVKFVMQPTDPAQQKIVLDATKAYAPIATKDLPLLDAGVKSACGFGLNLLTAAP
jgi:hypothetical protein